MSEIIWSNCYECNRGTKHTVVCSKIVSNLSSDYRCDTKYFIIECNGCGNISFRKEFHDYEDWYQIGEDEYEHSIDVEIFPHYIDGHSPIEEGLKIPQLVDNIYRESLQAIKEGAFTLAGLGLRATIEAICNHKEIKGKNLQVRINTMQRSGMISKSDADRLHAIRFMGNDAAHEIKKARKESVLIALKIIEHMLLSVYILEDQVNKHLEPPINSINEAIELLKDNLYNMEPSAIFTFAKWVGNAKRRMDENIEHLENELNDLILQGTFKWVELVDAPEGAHESKLKWYKRTSIDLPLKKADIFDF